MTPSMMFPCSLLSWKGVGVDSFCDPGEGACGEINGARFVGIRTGDEAGDERELR